MTSPKNQKKDTAVVIIAWLIALSLVFLVYLKFRTLFHRQ